MKETTLYYTLSTIPQILAATSAVLAAFIHFRLTTVHNILVGDGKATLDRSDKREIGYILDDGLKDRLRDGIHRKSIGEIKEILAKLKDIEIQEVREGKISKEDRKQDYNTYLTIDSVLPKNTTQI